MAGTRVNSSKSVKLRWSRNVSMVKGQSSLNCSPGFVGGHSAERSVSMGESQYFEQLHGTAQRKWEITHRWHRAPACP